MKYHIYTRVYDKEGNIFADNANFIEAMNYIPANELTDVEPVPGGEQYGRAKMIFKGTRRGRGTVEAELIRPGKGAEHLRAYDITARVIWGDREIAKGQEIEFIELLDYIKINKCEIVERTRGNLTVNGMTFYSNFEGYMNKGNRIEVIITGLN